MHVCRRTGAHGGEHAERGAGDAVHVGEREGDVDGDRDDQAGHDGALVAQRQAEDDVGCRARAAGVRHVLCAQQGRSRLSQPVALYDNLPFFTSPCMHVLAASNVTSLEGGPQQDGIADQHAHACAVFPWPRDHAAQPVNQVGNFWLFLTCKVGLLPICICHAVRTNLGIHDSGVLHTCTGR